MFLYRQLYAMLSIAKRRVELAIRSVSNARFSVWHYGNSPCELLLRALRKAGTSYNTPQH